MDIQQTARRFVTENQVVQKEFENLKRLESIKPAFESKLYYIQEAQESLNNMELLNKATNNLKVAIEQAQKTENELLYIFDKYFKDSTIVFNMNDQLLEMSTVSKDDGGLTIKIKGH